SDSTDGVQSLAAITIDVAVAVQRNTTAHCRQANTREVRIAIANTKHSDAAGKSTKTRHPDATAEMTHATLTHNTRAACLILTVATGTQHSGSAIEVRNPLTASAGHCRAWARTGPAIGTFAVDPISICRARIDSAVYCHPTRYGWRSV